MMLSILFSMQAYIAELEAQVAELEEEHAQLLREQVLFTFAFLEMLSVKC
jgi:hypothetical protein